MSQTGGDGSILLSREGSGRIATEGGGYGRGNRISGTVFCSNCGSVLLSVRDIHGLLRQHWQQIIKKHTNTYTQREENEPKRK